ncbi:hypothetical protein DPMN_071476 [Dreissena polymorpha]|uniref:Uncharacterized protein n=1 Tax=Dreissena polymorpha TaxID=45954 RepID=A0A9D3Z4Q0_DREPO|nr:hypothetical protein DPMN_071476 [Dreissena polymorpha]
MQKQPSRPKKNILSQRKVQLQHTQKEESCLHQSQSLWNNHTGQVNCQMLHKQVSVQEYLASRRCRTSQTWTMIVRTEVGKELS